MYLMEIDCSGEVLKTAGSTGTCVRGQANKFSKQFILQKY